MSTEAIVSMVIAVVIFKVQTWILQKTERRILQLIPLFVIGLVYVVALCLFLSDLNRTGGVLMNTIFSFVITGFNTVALIADGFAWLMEKV